MEHDSNIKGIVWQLEKGVQGTQHLQGYVQFKEQTRLTAVRKYSLGAHWEPKTFGDDAHMIAYVQKEDTRMSGPWSIGEIAVSRPGRRNDIALVLDEIQKGARPVDLLKNEDTRVTYVKHGVNLDKAAVHLGVHRRKEQTVAMILWGPPLTGKTEEAPKICEANKWSYYTAPQARNANGNPWFDGYNGEDAVIVHEMDGGWCKPTFYINLIDKCDVKVEFKGGSCAFTSKVVIFTSNRDPMTWWSREVMIKNPGLESRLQNSNRAEVRYFPPERAEFVRQKLASVPIPGTMRSLRGYQVEGIPVGTQAQQVQNVLTEDGGSYHPRFEVVNTTRGAIAPTFIPVQSEQDREDRLTAETLALTSQGRAQQGPRGFTPEEWTERQQEFLAARRKRRRNEDDDGSDEETDDAELSEYTKRSRAENKARAADNRRRDQRLKDLHKKLFSKK